MRLRSGLLAIAIACTVSKPAAASVIIFTDGAIFEAVVQPNVLATFDTLAGFDSADPTNFCPYISIPVCGGVVDGILNLASSEIVGGVDWNGGHVAMYGPFGYVDVGLLPYPTALTAYGSTCWQHRRINCYNSRLRRQLRRQCDGSERVPRVLFSRPVTTTVQVQRHTFPYHADDPTPMILDNFIFKSVPVPEPSSLLLFAGACALVGMFGLKV